MSFDLDFELAAAGGHYVSEEGDQRRSIFYIHEDKLSNFLTFETPRWKPAEEPLPQKEQEANAKPAEEPQKEQEANAKPAEEPQKEQEATAKPAEEPQKSHKKSHKIDTESHQKAEGGLEKDEGDGGWFLCDDSASSVYVDV